MEVSNELKPVCGNCVYWIRSTNSNTPIGKCGLSFTRSLSFPLKKSMHSNCGLSTVVDFGCREFKLKLVTNDNK